MKRKKLLILAIGIGMGGLILVSIVSAQREEVGVSISPLTFELTANPGDAVSNKLKVYNPTGASIGIKMEVEDFKAVGEIGEVVVSPEEEITFSFKRWVEISPSEFALGPREQKFVDFTINIPVNAEPGGKYGSVLATTTGVVGEEIVGTAIAQKVGALVLLTVAGEVEESLTVKEFSAPSFLEYGPVPFTIRFENTGTVHLRPRGFVVITDWRAKKVADVKFPQSNVIPGAVRKIETQWQNKWLFGKYTAMLIGGYGTTNTSFNPVVLTFWAFPWKIISGILLVLIVILTFFYKTRKRWILALKILVKGRTQ